MPTPGELFSYFVDGDPNTVALPQPAPTTDRLAVVRGALAYYAELGSLGIPKLIGDGQKGIDGSLPSGSNILTMPSALCVSGAGTAAYVGEPITIEGAGANFYVAAAASSAAGSGYRNDDILTTLGGCAIRVVATDTSGAILPLDANGIPGFQVLDVGESGTNPAGAQAVTGGAGTGATFVLTWQHVNLVTTIAAVNNETELQLTDSNAAGADLADIEWGFATDFSDAINARLALGLTSGGGQAWIIGYCGIASTIAYGNNNLLFGSGAGSNREAASGLMWIGPHRGVMVSDGDPAAAVEGPILDGFALFGMSAAGTCLRSHGDSFGRYGQLALLDYLNIGWDIDASSLSGGSTRIPFIGGRIDNVSASNNRSSGKLARGVVIGAGTDASDSNFINATNLFVTHQNGTGLELGASDRSVLANFTGQATAGGTGQSMVLRGTNNLALGRCTGWYMTGVQPLAGWLVRCSGLARTPVANVAILGRENAAPVPTIERPLGGVFSGSISGTAMTITGVTSGVAQPGQTIAGTGVTAGATITAYGTGTGGAGTYTVSVSMAATGAITIRSAGPNPELLCTTTKGRNNGTAPTGSWAATATVVLTATALTTIISATGIGSRVIKGGTFQAGMVIEAEVWGVFSTPGGNTDSFTITMVINDSVTGDLIVLTTAGSPATPVMPAAATNQPIHIKVVMTLRDVFPATSNLLVDGRCEYGNATNNGTLNLVTMTPGTVSLDTRNDQTLTLRARWDNHGGHTTQTASFTNGFYRWYMPGQGGLF